MRFPGCPCAAKRLPNGTRGDADAMAGPAAGALGTALFALRIDVARQVFQEPIAGRQLPTECLQEPLEPFGALRTRRRMRAARPIRSSP
ncbi:hypothetical protein CHELA40_30206 [Chelatococcus asaccharovorans]|nr:hypothetical protein CHELA40_30206 [Chelatococcus asaccharovorans]